MPLTILIIDDHKIIRDGLRALLERGGDFVVVGEAANGRDGIAQVELCKPAVVIMDLAMPELNGVEATRQLRASGYTGGIVMLSAHNERRFVAQSLEAGADGFVHKDHAFEQVREAIQRASKRETYLSPDVAHLEKGGTVQTPADLLTPREREVLQLLAEGHNVKEIAFRLDISVKTVETHRMHLMTKLKVDNLADLTRLAMREGLAQG